MAQLLEMAQLAKDDGPTQGHCRGGGVQTELDPQRAPQVQLPGQVIAGDNLIGVTE
jgi:hypothetical protein